MACRGIHYLINPWQMEAVFRTRLVKSMQTLHLSFFFTRIRLASHLGQYVSLVKLAWSEYVSLVKLAWSNKSNSSLRA